MIKNSCSVFLDELTSKLLVAGGGGASAYREHWEWHLAAGGNLTLGIGERR